MKDIIYNGEIITRIERDRIVLKMLEKIKYMEGEDEKEYREEILKLYK